MSLFFVPYLQILKGKEALLVLVGAGVSKVMRGRDGVDFARLMSQDYGRVWLEQRERFEQQHRDKLKVSQSLSCRYLT